MTENYDWETVEVPAGSFIGWGTTGGQHVTGRILSYSPLGGVDFNGDACPELTIELTDRAASFNKNGERTDYPAGEMVNLTVGQLGLKKAVTRADPNVGDMIKITMTGTEKTTKGNEIKVFDLKIARGSGQTQRPPASRQPAATPEPPF